MIFKFRFDVPQHAPGDKRRHIQNFKLIVATGDQAGLSGEAVAEGSTVQVVRAGQMNIVTGVVPEPWAADAVDFQVALRSVHSGGLLDVSNFENKTNTFHNRNVTAIVLEVPNSMIGDGEFRLWSIVSLVWPRARSPDSSVRLSLCSPISSCRSRPTPISWTNVAPAVPPWTPRHLQRLGAAKERAAQEVRCGMDVGSQH